jgi:L-alanine-DL-glutamate epimerase-like enolase superfamily enzyme
VKIQQIEVINLSYEYTDEEDRNLAEGHMGARLTSLVRVSLDTGLIGIGAAYSHPELVRIIVEDHLAPFLIGEDPRRTDMLWERMYSLTRWYGRKGVALSALGGVDGFTVMKMRLGRDDAYDRAAVRHVHDALGGRGRVAVDGTHRYSIKDARELGTFLAANDVAWFEEPFPPEDIDAYVALRPQIDVPLTAGENEFGVQGFRELFRAGAIDIAQPDASRTGGVTECRRIGKLAESHGIDVMSHTWSDAVALAANAHVIAALPNGIAVEIDRTSNPFMTELILEEPKVNAGRLHLGTAPGLGIELNHNFVEEHRRAPGFGTPNGNYSDLVFGGGPYTTVPSTARA